MSQPMTRHDIIQKLRDMGVENVWGRGLSTRTKAELLEFLNHCEAEAADNGIRHLSYSGTSIGAKVSAAEFRQYLRPVGSGPSSNTWPR